MIILKRIGKPSEECLNYLTRPGRCSSLAKANVFRKKPFAISERNSAYCVDYANEKQDLNKLRIQPIGLNYHIYNKFQADLIINFGTPFTLQDLNLQDINSKKHRNYYAEKPMKDWLNV